MVTNANPGLGILPTYLTNLNGTLYFQGYSTSAGHQVFKYVDVPGGIGTTTMVTSINPGGSGCSPAYLTAAGSTLYFTASDGTHGSQLWETTGSGATMLTTANVTGRGSLPSNLTAVGSTLYFVGFDSTGYQLWSSTGTPSTTTRLTSLGTYPVGLLPSRLTAMPSTSTLYFTASLGTHGAQLWDSTGGSTTMLTDIDDAGGGLHPDYLTAVGSTLYFSANDGTYGTQLWKSNSGGTAMVADINGTAGAYPSSLTNVNGVLYFVAYTSTYNYQIWHVSSSGGVAMDTTLSGSAAH
jgi:ELWxxDGT repeat protein